MAEDLVVTAAHNGSAYPLLVAEDSNQCAWAVDVLLSDDGPHETLFYVSDGPVTSSGPFPRRWMRTGYHRGFGATFFHDDSTPPGADWAWIALNPQPLADAPTIFYDVPTPVIFPPVAVMPLDRLREVILEWCRTGQQPTGVDWMAVNSQVWDLDEDGGILPEPARPRRTMHSLIRREVVREYGWGTDRTAPEPATPERELILADHHRTGRTAFGTAGPHDT